MNNISEKQSLSPLLPTSNPITHTTTTTAPSVADKIFATMDAFTHRAEKVNRALYSLSTFVMMVTQVLCLVVVLSSTAWLAYLFTTGHRVNSPELALEVICYIAPFLAFGAGVRFMELVSVFAGYRQFN
ncbi:hypothetical protein VF21_06006 [Pseudogymnoascus sp. 05NY08]|nr:hypothetical protein VF21_06006 [Pseudogymnoascus sp. 05NY08]